MSNAKLSISAFILALQEIKDEMDHLLETEAQEVVRLNALRAKEIAANAMEEYRASQEAAQALWLEATGGMGPRFEVSVGDIGIWIVDNNKPGVPVVTGIRSEPEADFICALMNRAAHTELVAFSPHPKQTNITDEHRDQFAALVMGQSPFDFALFSCFVNGEPTAAIVALHTQDSVVCIHPIFVAVTDGMDIRDHEGNAPDPEDAPPPVVAKLN